MYKAAAMIASLAVLVAALSYAWPRINDLWQEKPKPEALDDASYRCPLAADALIYQTPDGYYVWSPGERNAWFEDTWFRVAAGCEKEARQIIKVPRLPKRPGG